MKLHFSVVKGSRILLAGYAQPFHRKPSHVHCAITSKMTLQGHGITLMLCCLLFFFFFFLHKLCGSQYKQGLLAENHRCFKYQKNGQEAIAIGKAEAVRRQKEERKTTLLNIFLAFSYSAVIRYFAAVSFQLKTCLTHAE